MTLHEGEVTSVSEEDGIILLNVDVEGAGTVTAAFGKLSSDFIVAPQEGDVVALQQTDQGRYVATSVISKTENDSPEVDSGELAFQLNDDNLVRIQETGDGYKFILDLTDNVEIQSEKDIQLIANGNIVLGKDGEPVARQDHTHDGEYSWTDEAGSGTFTTEKPNEEGSELEIP